MSCRRYAAGRKQTSTICLTSAGPILTDIKTFKKKNPGSSSLKNRRPPRSPCLGGGDPLSVSPRGEGGWWRMCDGWWKILFFSKRSKRLCSFSWRKKKEPKEHPPLPILSLMERLKLRTAETDSSSCVLVSRDDAMGDERDPLGPPV